MPLPLPVNMSYYHQEGEFYTSSIALLNTSLWYNGGVTFILVYSLFFTVGGDVKHFVVMSFL